MLIGITGKSGAGKTTVAKSLNEKLNDSTIISVDPIDIGLILSNSDKLIEIYGDDIIDNGNLNIELFIQSPEKGAIIHDLTANELIRLTLEQIKQKQLQYSNVIVEWIRLTELGEIWKLCDYHILVEPVNPEIRYENLVRRHKSNRPMRDMNEEFKIRDFYNPNYQGYTYDSVITNNYDDSVQQDINSIAKTLKRKYVYYE